MMRFLTPLAGILMLAAPSLAGSSSWTVSLDQPDYAPGELITLSITGQPGQFGFVLFDFDNSSTEILPGLILDLGITANFTMAPLVIPGTGTAELLCEMDCDLAALIQGMGSFAYAQAVSLDPLDGSLCVSNEATLDASNTYGFCGSCAPCDGGVSAFTMRYNGASSAYVEFVKEKKNSVVYFAGNLQPGEVFSFLPEPGKDKFAKKIEVLFDGHPCFEFKTNCKEPMGPGTILGDFLILESSSKEAGPICPEPAPGSGTDCTAGKPLKLEMKYTGGDCSASDHDQSPDKATCDGDPGHLSTVHIVASGKKGAVYFCDAVDENGTFWIDPEAIGESKLDNSLIVEIFDEDDNWLQTVTFHASCSQPLAEGNVFGGVELVTFVPKP